MNATSNNGSTKTDGKRASVSSRRRASRELPCDPSGLAGFRGINPHPHEVAMLPMESATWLAPEFYVALPRSAVLRIERRSDNFPKFATADFTGFRAHRAPCPDLQPWGTSNDIVPPTADDLQPFPWEARALVRQESHR